MSKKEKQINQHSRLFDLKKLNKDLFVLCISLLFLTLPLSTSANGLIMIVTSLILITNLFHSNYNYRDKLTIILIPLIIYIFFVVGHFYSEDKQASVSYLLRTVSLVVLPCLFYINWENSIKKYTLFIFTFYGAILVVCFISIVDRMLFTILTNRPFYTLFRYYNTHNNFSKLLPIHPGYLALFIVFALFVNFHLFSKSARKLKFVFSLTFIILFLALIMTSSRIHIISFFSCSIIAFMFFEFNKSLSRVRFYFICILITVSPLIMYKYIPNVKSRFDWILDHEFTQSKRYLSGESRLPRIKVSIEKISLSPFWGYGTGDSTNELVKGYKEAGLSEAFEKKYNAHNQFLEIWLKSGIIPVVLLIVYIFYCTRLALKNKSYLFISVIIPVALFFLVESALSVQKGIIYFALIFPLMIINSLEYKPLIVAKQLKSI